MNRISTIVLITIATLLAIASCKKKDVDSGYWMRAKTGMVNFNVNSCTGIAIGDQLSVFGYSYVNSQVTAPQIEITVRHWTGTAGTYYIGTTADSSSATYTALSGTTSTGNGGTIIITLVTATDIRGTFSFTCADGMAVSSGSFKAKRV